MPVDATPAPPFAPFLPVATAAAQRAADAAAIDDFGLAGAVLMETASRGAADAIRARYGPHASRTVAVACGKGNNGGDGLALARLLHGRGAYVHVYHPDEAGGFTDDAGRNLRLLQRLARDAGEGRLTLHPLEDATADALAGADLLVDALLGTGLDSDLRAPYDAVVHALNASAAPVVAIDVPTGLHADTGAVLGAAVRADLTVTMGALKPGLLFGAAHAGDVVVVDIGLPGHLLAAAMDAEGGARYTTDAAVRRWLPERSAGAHKYSVGLALVVAGSAGLTGAPVMAATAAARAGAGAVVCACGEDVQPLLAGKLTEVMTLGLPTDDAGALRPEAALDALDARLDQARALLVGPGLGRQAPTARFVRALLADAADRNLPAVVDADGLNALAGHTDLLERAEGRWVLTPHAGEFGRLAGEDVALDDRIRTARAWAVRWGCVLLLKGMPSVVAAPGGAVYVGGTGGPALATAGTGDVLAGLCTGLLAQGLEPVRAAVCALHLGGAAADRYAAHRAARTLLATDLLDELPHVLHERFA